MLTHEDRLWRHGGRQRALALLSPPSNRLCAVTSHTRRHTPLGGTCHSKIVDCACVLQPIVKILRQPNSAKEDVETSTQLYIQTIILSTTLDKTVNTRGAIHIIKNNQDHTFISKRLTLLYNVLTQLSQNGVRKYGSPQYTNRCDRDIIPYECMM